MSEKSVVLTYDGLKEKEKELKILKTVRRRDVAQKIKEAREQGDLSENAEYDSAKDEQAEIEAKIVFLEKMLRNAVVLDEDEVDRGSVNIGCKVLLYDSEFDEEIEYSIVGSPEADPTTGKISDQSPLGNALMGHKVNDIVEFEAPGGISKFKVLEIS